MHIVIVTDQHPDTLGGAQVSIQVQRTFLERAGHTVSVVAPRLLTGATSSRPVIELPAMPITRDRGYAASWPGKRSVRRVLRALAGAPEVSLVHVQGDFWGALIGYQLARSLNVPVVNTLHNNLDAGTRALTPFAGLAFWALRAVRRLVLGPVKPIAQGTRGGWAYLAALAADTDALVAPSRHFAATLERQGVPGPFTVIPTGVHDDLLDEVLQTVPERAQPPALVWSGRMSPEKRLIELLEAFADFIDRGGDATLTLIGAGLQESQARRLVHERGLRDRVRFTGPLSHRDALDEMFRADALVQTSRGFETQGMTPYEAAALGTPTLFCDVNIASEIDVAPGWIVPDASQTQLSLTIEQAVSELSSAPAGSLRVPALLADGLRQSQRTEAMLEVYRGVLER